MSADRPTFQEKDILGFRRADYPTAEQLQDSEIARKTRTFSRNNESLIQDPKFPQAYSEVLDKWLSKMNNCSEIDGYGEAGLMIGMEIMEAFDSSPELDSDYLELYSVSLFVISETLYDFAKSASPQFKNIIEQGSKKLKESRRDLNMFAIGVRTGEKKAKKRIVNLIQSLK